MKFFNFLIFLFIITSCTLMNGISQNSFLDKLKVKEKKGNSFLSEYLISTLQNKLSKSRDTLFFITPHEKNTIKALPMEEVPIEVNTFHVSPNFNATVMFGDGYEASKFIYFYSAKGELMKKEEVNIYPNISYSVNGEYIVVYNNFGKQFMIYDKDGNKIYHNYNYQDLIKSKKAPMSHVSTSEDGQLFLIRADSLYLFNINEELLWTAPSNYVLETAIYHFKNIILVKKLQAIGSKTLSVEGLSLENGSTLGTIKNINNVFFRTGHFFVIKQNQIYEYNIK